MSDAQTARLWPDPPELEHMSGQFKLGYRQAQQDASLQIRQHQATATARRLAARVLAAQIEFLDGNRKRAWEGDFVARLGAAAYSDRAGCLTCVGEAEIGTDAHPHQREICPDCDPRAPGFAIRKLAGGAA